MGCKPLATWIKVGMISSKSGACKMDRKSGSIKVALLCEGSFGCSTSSGIGDRNSCRCTSHLARNNHGYMIPVVKTIPLGHQHHGYMIVKNQGTTLASRDLRLMNINELTCSDLPWPVLIFVKQRDPTKIGWWKPVRCNPVHVEHPTSMVPMIWLHSSLSPGFCWETMNGWDNLDVFL